MSGLVNGPGILSFFAGIGILDLGFEAAGFEVGFANEREDAFRAAYLHGRKAMGLGGPGRGMVGGCFGAFLEDGSWQQALMRSVLLEHRQARRPVGFVGGPPCPDFSISGSGRGEHGETGRFLRSYVDLIRREKPDFFVLENVRGLWSTTRNKEFFRSMVAALENAGFGVNYRLVNAIHYGVPQDRQRLIAVGFHEDAFGRAWAREMARGFLFRDPAEASGGSGVLGQQWPKPEAFERGKGRPAPDWMEHWRRDLTVEAWFDRNGVEEHPNGSERFNTQTKKGWFNEIKEGDSSGRCFKRLHRHGFSPTAAYGNNEVHLHPYEPRRLSVAEAMAVQSIPRAFCLPGRSAMSLSDKFKSVGNAVPYLLALNIAQSVRSALRMPAELGALGWVPSGRVPIVIEPRILDRAPRAVQTSLPVLHSMAA